ncbi:MAG: flavodoxin domain-containing protein [Pseudomonadota bacterium]
MQTIIILKFPTPGMTVSTYREMTTVKMGMVIGSTTGNTREVGVAIKNALGDRIDEIFDVESKKLAELTGYDVLLVGIPTWDIGQLQEDWIFALKQFEGLDFEGTKVAFFGDGDQVNYPYNFQDAMGILPSCRI